DRVIGVCQQSDGLPDGSPFIFVRVKTASAVTLWFNLFMVQLVYGSTCLWFNLFMVQLVYGSTYF
ncbi:hypothetical protein, partial [Yersinia pestis]|uniref:hypothetical protein n=1 Tax=Yersinia pestis TaxID=632 RepID=UPI001EE4A5F5